MNPHSNLQQRAHHGLVGRPYDGDAVISAPVKTPLVVVPVDALYTKLIQRFTRVQDVDKPVVTLTPGEIAERAVVAQGYDVDKYRKEINLGLKHARVLLRGYATSWRDSQDLKQTVDIEIWKSILRYKDRMTPELAYTIARNHGGRFLKRQRKEQTTAVTTPDGPVLDEFGKPKRIPRFESF